MIPHLVLCLLCFVVSCTSLVIVLISFSWALLTPRFRSPWLSSFIYLNPQFSSPLCWVILCRCCPPSCACSVVLFFAPFQITSVKVYFLFKKLVSKVSIWACSPYFMTVISAKLRLHSAVPLSGLWMGVLVDHSWGMTTGWFDYNKNFWSSFIIKLPGYSNNMTKWQINSRVTLATGTMTAQQCAPPL